ncbi:transposase [Mesorhizobium sp. M0954]|uniref:transposase n=1 Tax=Mesorhizobium sp. M0954 TaxID=2957032 RepID=UPI0033354211
MQETEKPGVSVAEVCRRHGVATSTAFRWRVEFRPDRSQDAAIGNCCAHPWGEKTNAGDGSPVQSRAAAGRHGGSPTGQRAARLCVRRQQCGCSQAASRGKGERIMIVVAAGVKMHLALGHTDRQEARRARHTDPGAAERWIPSRIPSAMDPDHIERDISEGATITPRRSEPGKAQPKRGPLPDHPPRVVAAAPCPASARALARSSTIPRRGLDVAPRRPKCACRTRWPEQVQAT